ARLALVVLASYFFYMSWFPIYGALLLFLTGANWALGLGLARANEAAGGKKATGLLKLQKRIYLWA
ncbi:MAG: hypothetical protein ACRD3W_19685, partial [Terriglobales bacterium]